MVVSERKVVRIECPSLKEEKVRKRHTRTGLSSSRFWVQGLYYDPKESSAFGLPFAPLVEEIPNQ